MSHDTRDNEIRVGSTLWHFDINRRVYRDRKPGERHVSEGPIYAKHFAPYTVTGETKQAWIVDFYGVKTRVNKVTLIGARDQWYTHAGMEDNIWACDHCLKLQTKLWGASTAQLREVARVLGYAAEGST